jgi:protein TonB
MFNPNASNEGSFPPPEYPGFAQRNHYQGTVTIEIQVDEAGTITSAKVQKTSGYSVLDEAALRVVKTGWHFKPGPSRWLLWPCIFKID